MSDLDNKVLMYSVTEAIIDDNGVFVFAPAPIRLTKNRDKLMSFLDNYILTEIEAVIKYDKEDDEHTEIHVDVDQNWWKNLNNTSFPIEPDNYPEQISITKPLTSIGMTSYIALFISEGYIVFL
jgi:hypothetical protein